MKRRCLSRTRRGRRKSIRVVSADEFDSGDVLAIYVDIMGRLGKWRSPLRDEGALDEVLQRVEASRLEGADVIRRAAILAVGLVQERPFEEGSLPTAFATLEGCLSINGFAFRLGSERRIGNSFVPSQKSSTPRRRSKRWKIA